MIGRCPARSPTSIAGEWAGAADLATVPLRSSLVKQEKIAAEPVVDDKAAAPSPDQPADEAFPAKAKAEAEVEAKAETAAGGKAEPQAEPETPAEEAEATPSETADADAAVKEKEDAEPAEAAAENDDQPDDDAADNDDQPGDAGAEEEAGSADAGEAGTEEIGDASFAHAPTSTEPRTFDEDDVLQFGDDEDEEPQAAGLDKRPDVLWWLLTPVLLLVVPLLTASITFFVAQTETGYPAICRAAAPENGCEETVLGMAALHTLIFLAGWLILWALPWWRGLRKYRIGVAVAITLILLAVPVRLLATVDYQSIMGG